MVATQHLDSGVASCRFKSNFTSTNKSVLLSAGLCNGPLNTWTQGLSPVNSLPTFLPLTSLSYCLSASVRCPSTPGLRADSCRALKFTLLPYSNENFINPDSISNMLFLPDLNWFLLEIICVIKPRLYQVKICFILWVIFQIQSPLVVNFGTTLYIKLKEQ